MLKAVSVRPEWAHLIFCEIKSIEVRTWRVKAPCDLWLCTSNRKYKYFPGGYCVAQMHITECVKMIPRLLDAACMDEMPEKDSYGWIINGVYACEPFPVKGKLHLYDIEEPEGGIRWLDTPMDIYNAYKPLLPGMPDTFEEAYNSIDYGAIMHFDLMGREQEQPVGSLFVPPAEL